MAASEGASGAVSGVAASAEDLGAGVVLGEEAPAEAGSLGLRMCTKGINMTLSAAIEGSNHGASQLPHGWFVGGALRSLLLVLIASFLSGCGYNTMVTEKEAVDGAWSEVENQLQRRNDLIPNLVETVKGFAAQEKEVFVGVAEARNQIKVAAENGERADQIAASNAMTASLSRLVGVVERYPDLKSDQNFLRLQDELAGTENRLTVARKRYNDAVRVYNTTTKRFPANMVARIFGFGEEDYFDAPESAEGVPEISF